MSRILIGVLDGSVADYGPGVGQIDSIKNSILPDIKKNRDSLCRAITRQPNKSRADRHGYYAVTWTNWIKPS
jgi:hypothetical protein